MVRPRFVQTTRDEVAARRAPSADEPGLVVAWHPHLARVGDVLALPARVTEVSRLSPHWTRRGEVTGPLDDPFLSRSPFELWRLSAGGVEVANPRGVALEVGGEALGAGERRRVSAEQLGRGVPLLVGARVVLVLAAGLRDEPDDLGLAGVSPATAALRQHVRRAASAPGPILILGETGTGKELVARALHARGPRAGAPLVAVNVAAIPAATAAAELFGHERGAFTGAGEARPGYFGAAAGGTLFLDEVGELVDELQPVLLRALESGEVQPVGGRPRAVEVTVIAATDAALGAAVAAGRFRSALYYRLAAEVVPVPPLRDRGADSLLLLARFLEPLLPVELRDQSSDEAPLLSARAAVGLMARAWPGNVRELRNAAGRLASWARAGRVIGEAELAALGASAGGGAAAGQPAAGQPAAATTSVSPLGRASDDGAVGAAPARRRPAPEVVDDERLVAALRQHRFALAATARALGISRSHLDALIARSARLRKAKDLSRAEIEACRGEVGDDLEAMAARLEVGPRGLLLRLRQLGL